ncbi:caspase family protein [Pseudoduganella sp. OTU4001]|uniref:caspase family protein n=1 Tax=Pseudoduganella sp. OTU4001 TaxID=3043854 RepID=UPI00313C9EC2
MVVACAAHTACLAESPKELRKLALVIGNATYTNALPLENSSNDASDMCEALLKLNFEVICKLNLTTKREFKDAIYEFSGKTNEQTLALFYFAGHGMQIDGLNYLIPTKAALRTKSDIEDESVQINYLMSEMDGRKAALNIFLFDACRNNPFINPIRGYAPRLGLASQLYTPVNSILAMSTGSGQLSLDGVGRNGTFTKNLLKVLATPRQSVEDMLKAASAGTSEDARRLGRQQIPQITTSYTERYCLAGCDDPQLAARQLQLNAKSQELEKLQEIIAQTKAKQNELDQQKSALLQKQNELERMTQTLERTQQQQQEAANKQATTTAQKNAEAVRSLNADIEQANAKARELDVIKASLLKKQDELNNLRDTLNAQQAAIERQAKDVQTRSVEKPAEKKKPITIIPTF